MTNLRAKFIDWLAALCLIGAVLVAQDAVAAYAPPANLIQNGSFELGQYSGNDWTRVTAGDTKIADWTVGGTAVDWHNSGQMKYPQDGDKVVDLNMDYSGAGTLSQSFATTPGAWYTLTFQLAGPNDPGRSRPTVTVRVQIGGATRDFQQATSSNTALQWGEKMWSFRAESDTTTVTFSSPIDGFYWGPTIDNVAVTAGGGTDLYGIRPFEAENTGPVTLTVYGRSFQDGAVAKLQKDDESVAGSNVTILDGGLTLKATFDLTGKAIGLWDLSITNPDGSVASGENLLAVFSGVNLHGVFPKIGGNVGHRSLILDGERFAAGMTAKLSRAGEADIPATAVETVSTGEAEALFPLNGKALGTWDVIVTKPNGTFAALPAAFTIVPAEPPKVSVSVNGPGQVRLGRAAVYWITFTNTGNMDAVGVPVIHGIPRDAPWEILSQPEPELANIPENRKQPLSFLTDESATATRVLLLPITRVSASTVASVVLSVTLPQGDYRIQASWDQFPP